MENQRKPIIELHGVGKSFSGVTVLKGIDLEIFSGQVHVLAGENGAGKSTLMKILSGVYAPDAGTIKVDGAEENLDVKRAQELGITLVHQELMTVPNMSVADNLALGHEYRTKRRTLDIKKTRERAQAQLDRVGATFSVTEQAGRLSTGEQQLIEIAKALAEDPRVLILDEPTASLSAKEVSKLFRIVNQLRDNGTAIVYITHRMEEIQELCDAVTVLRDGQKVETLTRKQATPDEIIVRMVGRPIESLFETGRSTPGEIRLSAKDVTDGNKIGPISLDVRAGEVVGISGLVGAGRTEFARLVFGADLRKAGSVTVDGVAVKPGSVRSAMQAGLALVPESRKEQGLVLSQSVTNNIVLSSLKKISVGGVINKNQETKQAQKEKDRLGIKVANLSQEIRQLSGGNQQKALLSKWLLTDPKVLILDEPTRGVDVGAKADIYSTINECAERGMALVVISSDLPELLGLADRIAVVRAGKIQAVLENKDLTEEEVMVHAFGVSTVDETPKTSSPTMATTEV